VPSRQKPINPRNYGKGKEVDDSDTIQLFWVRRITNFLIDWESPFSQLPNDFNETGGKKIPSYIKE
jgi:hypothetical protein